MEMASSNTQAVHMQRSAAAEHVEEKTHSTNLTQRQRGANLNGGRRTYA